MGVVQNFPHLARLPILNAHFVSYPQQHRNFAIRGFPSLGSRTRHLLLRRVLRRPAAAEAVVGGSADLAIAGSRARVTRRARDSAAVKFATRRCCGGGARCPREWQPTAEGRGERSDLEPRTWRFLLRLRLGWRSPRDRGKQIS